MKTKICYRCKKEQPLLCFRTYKSGANNVNYRSYCRNCSKEISKEDRIKWKKSHPWYVSYTGAKQRCENPNYTKYHLYGGRGIKFLLTTADMKYLWGRDKGYELKHPSIDRIDSNGHYELSNCQFIEQSINSSKGGKKNWSNINELRQRVKFLEAELNRIKTKGDK